MRFSDAFAIDGTATPERVAQAAAVLAQCTGVVLLEPCLYLRPGAREIRCEVLDITSAAHRCEEEYKVLVENAARALGRSKLGALLPDRPLRWAVVEEHGDGVVEAWSDRVREVLP
jgi:hypothetical protein